MTTNPDRTADAEKFNRAADAARRAIGKVIAELIVATADQPQAQKAILLGAMAAVVGCWASAAGPDLSAEHLTEVLRETIPDFARQSVAAVRGASRG